MPSQVITDELNACPVQAAWMENSTYGWQSNPTVAKSQYKGTCVTYVACVLQRIGQLASGKYIWHNARGKVTGATSSMTVKYFDNKTLSQITNYLQAGDIVMDGSGSDMGSGSHIFIITGNWNGSHPYVWDNHSGQQQLGAYEYTRDRHIIAVVRLDESVPYTPRLDSGGMRGNPYWYSRNPFYLAGYGLPNCTCYAFGRWWEIADTARNYSNYPALCTGNAEDWWAYPDGYARGSTPQLGAVLCLADGPYSGDGHVAIVEEIDPDTGIITCSNSAYGGAYFYLSHLSPPDYLPIAGYVFQGFIYNPYSGGGPSPGPVGGSGGWILKRSLWHREEALLR